MEAAAAITNNDMPDALLKESGDSLGIEQAVADRVPTYWVEAGDLLTIMARLKPDYPMLFDLFGIDERHRAQRPGQPAADFTVVYHLLSFNDSREIRVKVAVLEPGHLNATFTANVDRQQVV